MRLRLIERLAPFLIGAMLLSHTALLAWSAYRHSPVVAEVGHLPAGISHWQFGRFDLYRVNPPLVRMVAALPMMLANPDTDWSNYSLDPLTRSETTVGIDFVNANGYRTFWLYTIGRWACIPFSLMGAAVCFVWARDLYGLRSGLAAMALWCFCPNILGNGSLIMPDVPAARLGPSRAIRSGAGCENRLGLAQSEPALSWRRRTDKDYAHRFVSTLAAAMADLPTTRSATLGGSRLAARG